MKRAQIGLEELRKHVDTIIVIPNQNLFKIANEQTTYKESFQLSNSILRHGVQSVTDLMVKDGLVNLDFADVETVMSSMGKAMMGTGEAEGEGRAEKATELALNNPLIDDYSLKGAKGLLINITGGEDLKLFEVDEIVNKIRSEVDAEAEIINGSIIDPSLDGRIRVSIVATSLDGQQPESKSVINMVHRIQNRNPGYSDLTTGNGTASFSFSNATTNPVTHGANALKLENEVVSESTQNESVEDVNHQYHEELLKNQQSEDIGDNSGIEPEIPLSDEETNSTDDQSTTNDLKEFGVDTDEPDLFNSEDQNNNIEDLLNSSENEDEDDLEIPAFLRRQKN
jgi:cell division protein FtsZ